jgi:hypothetical protein
MLYRSTALRINLHREKKDYEKEHGAGAVPPLGNACRPSGSRPVEPIELNLDNYCNVDLDHEIGCTLYHYLNVPAPFCNQEKLMFRA